MGYRYRFVDGKAKRVETNEDATQKAWWHTNVRPPLSGESAAADNTPLDVLDRIVSAMNKTCDAKWILRAMATFPGKRTNIDGVSLAKAVMNGSFPLPKGMNKL